jgi:hypothetical protein
MAPSQLEAACSYLDVIISRATEEAQIEWRRAARRTKAVGVPVRSIRVREKTAVDQGGFQKAF